MFRGILNRQLPGSLRKQECEALQVAGPKGPASDQGMDLITRLIDERASINDVLSGGKIVCTKKERKQKS
jgi:hypothetical protein